MRTQQLDISSQSIHGILWLSILLAGCFAQAEPARPIDAKIVDEAWTEAGARIGWMGEDEYDRFLEFEMKPDDLTDALPAYEIRSLRTVVGSNLPDPGKPFALSLYLSAATDAWLKNLAHLENLHALQLDAAPVTGAGFSALAGLKNLESLDLTSTKATDEGMKGVAMLQNLKTLDLFNTQ